eukprot:Skav209721  [mRNA]  locus=scaffold528:327038:334877:- [translate_table: standard]
MLNTTWSTGSIHFQSVPEGCACAASSKGRGCNVVLWEAAGLQHKPWWMDVKEKAPVKSVVTTWIANGVNGKPGPTASRPNIVDWAIGLGLERLLKLGSRQTMMCTSAFAGDNTACHAPEVVPDLSCAVSCTSSSVCTNGEWGQWSVWGPCTVTCGRGGSRSRTRVEKVKANHCGYPPEGEDVDYEPCNADVECESEMGAQDCAFGMWSEWEDPLLIGSGREP